MLFEAFADLEVPGQWRVEAFDEEGAPEIAIFIGKNAKQLSGEYAACLNRKMMREMK